jgi:uncharacterized protein with HEPN domain
VRNQNQSDVFYLKSILLAIDSIHSYAFSKDADKKTLRAATYELMTIGEAATKISTALKEANPQLPWRQIEGTRHRIVHEYFRIDPDMIAAIIADDLQMLEREVNRMLAALEEI